MTSLYIAPGILSEYQLVTDNKDINAAHDELVKLTEDIITLYSTNSAKVFWTEADALALHVIMNNQSLNRFDSDAAIANFDLNQRVLVDLAKHIEFWVTECKRVVFTDHLKQFVGAFSDTDIKFLVPILKLAANYADKPVGEVELKTEDDHRLFAMVDHLRAKVALPGLIRARLLYVIDLIKMDFPVDPLVAAASASAGPSADTSRVLVPAPAQAPVV